MLEFYRGAKARITTDHFERRGLHPRRFALAHLSSIRIVRTEPSGAGTQPVLGVSALVAGLVVVPLVGPVSRTMAAVLVLTLIVQSLFFLWPRRPQWQLVAVHHGLAVVVFASADRREFDQVCRALQRCIDYRRRLG